MSGGGAPAPDWPSLTMGLGKDISMTALYTVGVAVDRLSAAAEQRQRQGRVSEATPPPTAMPSAPRRALPTIPSESMADVAFLLLLFFLVGTAIRTETGLPVSLPPGTASGPAAVPSLLVVLVGADGAVLAGGEPVRLGELRTQVAGYATDADQPYVALQASRQTPYADYIAALDAVLLGHRDADVEPRLTLREPLR